MTPLVRYSTVAALGFVAGWFAYDRFVVPAPTIRPVIHTIATTDTNPVRPAQPVQPEADPSAAETDGFEKALRNNNAEAVIRHYQRALEDTAPDFPDKRAKILTHLQKLLALGQGEVFLDWADTWLSRYYDDIDILLLLANYQLKAGYPDEAARVFQYAFTYALQAGEQERVRRGFQSLVQQTDDQWSVSEQWIELLGFYQLLENIGLGSKAQQLRQAEIYIEIADEQSARRMALPLLDDPRLSERAKALIASLDQYSQEPSAPPVIEGELIPLQKSGEHYLVEVNLNGGDVLTLMIDTGASMTTLTSNSFRKLSNHRALGYLGWRLFNTANGYNRGNIYRVNSFQLGEQVLDDVEIAVLNFHQQSGIEGLLGMNVLKQFKFSINQDSRTLEIWDRSE